MKTPQDIEQSREKTMVFNVISEFELKSSLDYDPDTGVFRRKNGSLAGALSDSGYVRIKIKDKSYQAHRLAWLYVTGRTPAHQIDHIDGDRLNNRFSNLREANRRQNNYNSTSTPTVHSFPKGVSRAYKSSKFRAQIKTGGRTRHLGTFDTEDDASEFYQLAAGMLHGEFAFHHCRPLAESINKGNP